MHKLWIIFPILLLGCERPGDGQEGGSSKREYSILQALESQHRDERIEGVKVIEDSGYNILSLMGTDGLTRIWIMLDPQSPPFYKQIPSRTNYKLTDDQLELIENAGNPISTILHALESHLEQKKRQNKSEMATPRKPSD